jgi:lysophospholipase L1-like esterase
LLILTSSVLGYLLLEVVVRVLDTPPRPMAALPLPYYQLSDNPVRRFEYIPGFKSDEDSFGSSHAGFEINSAGFRDHEYEPEKPEDTYRILALGDSTTAGNGIRDVGKTFTKILERELNASGRSHRNFQVLNMGVGGYQTMQEVETLRTKGLAYDPDLVIVTVCENDLVLHADGRVYNRLKQIAQDPEKDAGPTWLGTLLKTSRLAFIIYYRLMTRLDIEEEDHWYADQVLHGRSALEAGLDLLAQLQRTHGFAVRVLVLPTFRVPFDEYDQVGYHERVQEASKGLTGVPVVDLLEGFASLDDDHESLSDDGLHMSARGHQVMAELLLPVILQVAGEADPR